MGYAPQQQQMMRQEAVNQIYQKKKLPVKKFEPIKAETKKEEKTLSEIIEVKPDLGDHIYVWIRSYVPSWIVLGVLLIGVITIFRKQIRQFLLMILGDK